MQYLLTAEEYEKLRSEALLARQAPDRAKLQALCTEVANTIPVKEGWYHAYPVDAHRDQ